MKLMDATAAFPDRRRVPEIHRKVAGPTTWFPALSAAASRFRLLSSDNFAILENAFLRRDFRWKSKLISGYSLKTRRSRRPLEETVFQPVTVIVRLRPIR